MSENPIEELRAAIKNKRTFLKKNDISDFEFVLKGEKLALTIGESWTTKFSKLAIALKTILPMADDAGIKKITIETPGETLARTAEDAATFNAQIGSKTKYVKHRGDAQKAGKTVPPTIVYMGAKTDGFWQDLYAEMLGDGLEAFVYMGGPCGAGGDCDPKSRAVTLEGVKTAIKQIGCERVRTLS